MTARAVTFVFRWTTGLITVAAVAFGIYCLWALLYYGADSRSFAWNAARTTAGTVEVSYVDPNGPANGVLKRGDRILSINGSEFLPGLASGIAVRSIGADGRYDVRINRHGQVQTISLRIATSRDWHLAFRQSPFLFGSLVSFVMALLLLKRSGEPEVRLFFAVLLCFGLRQALLVIHPFYNLMSDIEHRMVLIAWAPQPFYLMGAAMYHALYRFPSSVPKGRLWSVLQILLYSASGYFVAAISLSGSPELPVGDASIRFYLTHAIYGPSESRQYDNAINFYGLSALVAICAVVLRNYRLVENIGLRRRLRWVTFGFASGLSPYCVVLILQAIGEAAHIPLLQRGSQWTGVVWALNGWLAVIPVSFGYAVARHRLFDIRLIVRQGLQYLLARRMLQLLLVLPAAGLAFSIGLHPNRTVAQMLLDDSGALNIALLIAMAASLRYREGLRKWLDQRFFRQAYNSEEILTMLPARLRELQSPEEVAARVAEDVQAALCPRAIYVLAAQPSSVQFATIYSSDGHPIILRDDEEAWQHKSARTVSEIGNSTSGGDGLMQQRGIQLAVPMPGGGQRIAGLLLLAEKRSEEPYSSRDRALLEAIASQAAVLLEKFRLEAELVRERQQVRQMAVRLGDEVASLCRECPVCGTCYDGNVATCVNDGEVPVVVLPVDRTIQARYRLDRLVGKGGMGAVYQATDLRLKRTVAIKIMLSDLFGNELALQRFRREAEVSARLEHPNIVRIYDFGAVGTVGAYLVMEFLEGTTGRQLMQSEEQIAPATIAAWMDQLLAGLESAHAAGVVHRDLKPDNLLLVGEGEHRDVKILDFGLAKVKLLQIAEAEQLTVPGVTMGTVGYMSPEQFAGGDVDARTDVYAAATIALEMLTGSVPGDEEDNPEEDRLAASLEGDIAQLAAVLRTARARRRIHRYATAAEFRKELGNALRGIRLPGPAFRRAQLFERLGVELPSSLDGQMRRPGSHASLDRASDSSSPDSSTAAASVAGDDIRVG